MCVWYGTVHTVQFLRFLTPRGDVSKKKTHYPGASVNALSH
jgi:hypothetical protein